MFRKILLALVFVAVVVGGLVYTKLGQFKAMGEAGKAMVMPPETVTATAAQAMQWEQIMRSTGTASAVQGVTVKAEAPGRVIAIAFEPGVGVEAGAVLVQLDTAAETAQLAAAEASADLARATLSRRRELAKGQLVSPADIDTAAAQAKEAQAQVGVVRALIAKKTVRAPFAGRLGLRQVNIGQILREGDPIVSLQTLDPIYVDFSVPQEWLGRLGVGMTVRLTLSETKDVNLSGKLIAISPEVDPVTRTVRAQAQVDNQLEQLRAGMYVQVEVVRPETRAVLAIPATAIVYAPFGDSVFVVENGRGDQNGQSTLTLSQRFVKLGESRGDFVEVTEGIKDGDQVVTSGVFKLRSGMSVVVDNALEPKPSLDPTPPRS